jgi:hypothetical protein
MSGINPGPFEPFIYFVQTRPFYRLVALGGFVLFTTLALREAALNGGAVPCFVLAGPVRGQLARYEPRDVPPVPALPDLALRGTGGFGLQALRPQAAGRERRARDASSDTHRRLPFYGLFWLWHSIALGVIFTPWVPLAAVSAVAPGGFSWRKAAPVSEAA